MRRKINFDEQKCVFLSIFGLTIENEAQESNNKRMNETNRGKKMVNKIFHSLLVPFFYLFIYLCQAF